MDPSNIDLSLVAGTAGQYAVACSDRRGEWLVCLFRRTNGDQCNWTFVDSRATQELAWQLAFECYARDQARGACR